MRIYTVGAPMGTLPDQIYVIGDDGNLIDDVVTVEQFEEGKVTLTHQQTEVVEGVENIFLLGLDDFPDELQRAVDKRHGDDHARDPVFYNDGTLTREGNWPEGSLYKGLGWYFWDETGSNVIGKFDTEGEARAALTRYCHEVLGS